MKTLGDGSERASLVYIYSRQDEATDITGAWGCWLGQREWVGSLWLVDSVTNLLTMVCHFFLNFWIILILPPDGLRGDTALFGYKAGVIPQPALGFPHTILHCWCLVVTCVLSVNDSAGYHHFLPMQATMSPWHSTAPQKLDRSIMGPISKCGGSRFNRCHSFYCVKDTSIKLY